MKQLSYSVNPNLFLVTATDDNKSVAAPVPQPTNHILVIDCSGSMYDALPKIRAQIKAKLPKLLSDLDTISIVWFSGKRECGILAEAQPIASLKDLNDFNKMVDRWLKPVGLTGFKEPLELVDKLADRLGGACSLFFLTDGYDNQWSKSEILVAVSALAPKMASTTFVEYGYYCNKPLLVEMAEACGGALVFSEDFPRYEPTFDAAMQRRSLGVKKKTLDIKADAIKGFAYAIQEGSLLTFKVEGGKVTVPEYITELHYLSPALVGTQTDPLVEATLYAALALYAQRMQSTVVLALLKSCGDVRFIDMFANCFGKQKYAEFVDAATEACFNPNKRLTQGFNPDKIPDENAFTVLDVLKHLSSDTDNRILIDSSEFKYSRIGRGRVFEADLTDEEQEEVDNIKSLLEAAEGTDKAQLTKRLAAILDPKAPLKFVNEPLPNGTPVDALVYNEERPNVSFRVKRSGTVDIKARKGKLYKHIPDVFPSYVYRNYTVIKDGLLNVERLPVRLTGSSFRAMVAAGLPMEAVTPLEGDTKESLQKRLKKASDDREVSLVLDLKAMPIINRKMVKEVSAKELLTISYELVKAQAEQKVFKGYLAETETETSKSPGYEAIFGAEAAVWLKEQGFSESSGFSPKSKSAPKSDVYLSKELKVSLKGYSTLPTLKDAQAKTASGKHTVTSSLMAPHIEAIEKFQASDIYKTAADKPKILKAWLEGQFKAAQSRVRSYIYQVSQIQFCVIVGQTWFSEFSSLDENTLDLTLDGNTIKGTFQLKESEIAI